MTMTNNTQYACAFAFAFAYLFPLSFPLLPFSLLHLLPLLFLSLSHSPALHACMLTSIYNIYIYI
uniref:Uncharacterized protein n=1 Tax=Cannabis sativa TaxID=3483 RepID=A0A803RB88_CANSA